MHGHIWHLSTEFVDIRSALMDYPCFRFAQSSIVISSLFSLKEIKTVGPKHNIGYTG